MLCFLVAMTANIATVLWTVGTCKENIYKERRLIGFVVTNGTWCPVCNR